MVPGTLYYIYNIYIYEYIYIIYRIINLKYFCKLYSFIYRYMVWIRELICELAYRAVSHRCPHGLTRRLPLMSPRLPEKHLRLCQCTHLAFQVRTCHAQSPVPLTASGLTSCMNHMIQSFQALWRNMPLCRLLGLPRPLLA